MSRIAQRIARRALGSISTPEYGSRATKRLFDELEERLSDVGYLAALHTNEGTIGGVVDSNTGEKHLEEIILDVLRSYPARGVYVEPMGRREYEVRIPMESPHGWNKPPEVVRVAEEANRHRSFDSVRVYNKDGTWQVWSAKTNKPFLEWDGSSWAIKHPVIPNAPSAEVDPMEVAETGMDAFSNLKVVISIVSPRRCSTSLP